MIRFRPLLSFCVSLLVLIPGQGLAKEASPPQTFLAMTDEDPAVRSQGISHLAWVNAEAPKGGALKLGATGTFDSLQPFIIRGQTPLGLDPDTMPLVYERLMKRSWDEPFTLYGLLAESVEVPDDRSCIVFNLNKEAHFSDGTPVTADDVIFSFETLRDKGRPNHRTYYKKVLRAEKLSPTRVRFVFKHDANGLVDREMPLIMGYMFVMPRHDWQDRDFNQTTLRPPVGSGPYRVAAVDVARSITYERDPHYWGKDLPVQRGLYNFDKIRIDFYRDDSISLQAFKAHQYDLRCETNPTKWSTSYDTPAVTEGRLRLEQMAHRRVQPAYGYILNTRRALFADPVLRDALFLTFDFGWVNKNLFHGQYKRVDSLFPNSELVAPDLPEGREREILALYKENVPDSLFTEPVKPPEAATEEQFRENLLKAEKLLRSKGYVFKDGKLLTPSGTPVAFDVMLSDPMEEKVALNWASALRRIGIAARVHTVDSAQYQARLASFNFDVTANKWANSLSPGNEQAYYWGSAAADQKGSRNYAGVKDPVVDALAASLPKATTRNELVALAHAMDRVLMRGHYFIPLYYLSTDNIASWNNVAHPERTSLYGNVIESWWAE